MGFYDYMAKVATDLLAPDQLGQGVIELSRPVSVDEANPWGEDTVYNTATILGAVRGVGQELIGVEIGGTVIQASDRVAICEVSPIGYEAGDILIVDGHPVHIVAYQTIPAAGTPCASKFIIRG